MNVSVDTTVYYLVNVTNIDSEALQLVEVMVSEKGSLADTTVDLDPGQSKIFTYNVTSQMGIHSNKVKVTALNLPYRIDMLKSLLLYNKMRGELPGDGLQFKKGEED